MQPQPIPPVPDDTAVVAQAAFPKGNLYLQIRDTLGSIYQDESFVSLFSRRGQPAQSLWRLALVCVMQFIENLSDRQAADAVRARIDWKYALSLPLGDPGFNYSLLSEFRDRLVAGNTEQLLLEQLREKGLLKGHQRQRTDSTHVLAAIRVLNRLETLGETFRAALNSLAVVAPDWLEVHLQAAWFERYQQRAGIEGTLSQGVRRSGLRQSRYVGLAKTHLQHILTTVALNLIRLDAWLSGVPLAKTRASRFLELKSQVA